MASKNSVDKLREVVREVVKEVVTEVVRDHMGFMLEAFEERLEESISNINKKSLPPKRNPFLKNESPTPESKKTSVTEGKSSNHDKRSLMGILAGTKPFNSSER